MRLEESNRPFAKRLRQKMTPPEIVLWPALRRNDAGLRFRRQYPAEPYIPDFYCAPARVAIEVDGEAHERGIRAERDMARNAWLLERGVRVLRYSAREVPSDVEGVVAQIIQVANERVSPTSR